MFEFHGWITIRVDDGDDAALAIIREREQHALAFINDAIRDHGDNFSLFETRRTSNELIVLLAHGLRNHPHAPVIDLFRVIGERLPDSYGLLYVHDDDSSTNNNEFRVWRLALGRLEERDDPFLSPYIPTVERPWVEGI